MRRNCSWKVISCLLCLFDRYIYIMPTLLRMYSNHQSNLVLCDTIEFACRQFYIMHREPFVLQVRSFRNSLFHPNDVV